jgi:hypothetical protein
LVSNHAENPLWLATPYELLIEPFDQQHFHPLNQERSRLLRILFNPLFWLSIAFIIAIAFI